MRKNLPITGKNNDYAASQRIVSTTDTKGRITHVNEDFLTISGFDKEELIGKAHNIVRHPDMPSAAYEDLWKTIKTGKPWMGIVKNRFTTPPACSRTSLYNGRISKQAGVIKAMAAVMGSMTVIQLMFSKRP